MNEASFKRLYGIWLMGLLVVVGFGLFFQVFRKQLNVRGAVPELPIKPLAEFPGLVEDWQGRDLSMSETVLKVAGNDDYLSRVYKNTKTGQRVTLYIAYTSTPRNMIGHRPQRCYPGCGWTAGDVIERTIHTVGGETVPVLLHFFSKPEPEPANIVVLNYYIVNGEVTNDHKRFSGLNWRRPAAFGKTARYVVQVQINSMSESAVLTFGELIIKRVFEHLPEAPKD